MEDPVIRNEWKSWLSHQAARRSGLLLATRVSLLWGGVTVARHSTRPKAHTGRVTSLVFWVRGAAVPRDGWLVATASGNKTVRV